MTNKRQITPKIVSFLAIFTMIIIAVPQAQKAVYGQKVPYNTYIPVVFTDNDCANDIPYQPPYSLAIEADTLAALNQQRALNGISPLALNESLVQIARYHSTDMADSGEFSHTGSEGETVLDRFDWLCETFAAKGEIIGASSSGSIDNMVNAWMNSPGHRAIILSPDFTLAGVGYVYQPGSEYGHYWTVDFASKATTRDATAPSTYSADCTVETVTFEEGGILITSCE